MRPGRIDNLLDPCYQICLLRLELVRLVCIPDGLEHAQHACCSPGVTYAYDQLVMPAGIRRCVPTCPPVPGVLRRRVAQDNVLPEPAVVAEVLAIEPALVVGELQQRCLRLAARQRAEVGDEGRRHVHEVRPARGSQRAVQTGAIQRVYHSCTWLARCEIAPSAVRGARAVRYASCERAACAKDWSARS